MADNKLISAARAKAVVQGVERLNAFYRANGIGSPVSVAGRDFDGLRERGQVFVSDASGESFIAGVTVQRMEA